MDIVSAIIEYEGGGWNRIDVPAEGYCVLYPDGLLNVFDERGRVTVAPTGIVARVYMGMGAHPVYGDARLSPVPTPVDVQPE